METDASVPSVTADLAYVTFSFWGFDDRAHTGELLVDRRQAEALVEVDLQSPIARVDDRYLSFVAILMGAGADPNMRDREDRSSLDIVGPEPSRLSALLHRRE